MRYNLRPTNRECVHLVTRGHFRSRDKHGSHTIRSIISENPKLHTNFMALCFIEPELLPIKVLRCGNRNFRPCLLLWPWPWPDNLHTGTSSVSLETYRMCENELPISRLTKVTYSPLMRLLSYACMVTSGNVTKMAFTIRSAIVKNPMLHANDMAPCFVQLELLPIEVLHCRNRDFLPLLLLWRHVAG